MTGTFSAAGVSDVLLVKPGSSFTYAIAVGDGDAFIGDVRLERSEHGAEWEILAQGIGTEATPLEGAVASGTIKNEAPGARLYRFRCLVYDEASDDVNYSAALAVGTLERRFNTAGEEVFAITDEGITAAKVTATVLEAPGELIDFSAVPDTDPAVAGRLWLDTGVLKISTGA